MMMWGCHWLPPSCRLLHRFSGFKERNSTDKQRSAILLPKTQTKTDQEKLSKSHVASLQVTLSGPFRQQQSQNADQLAGKVWRRFCEAVFLGSPKDSGRFFLKWAVSEWRINGCLIRWPLNHWRPDIHDSGLNLRLRMAIPSHGKQ